jgi:hypothetical protein
MGWLCTRDAGKDLLYLRSVLVFQRIAAVEVVAAVFRPPAFAVASECLQIVASATTRT